MKRILILSMVAAAIALVLVSLAAGQAAQTPQRGGASAGGGAPAAPAAPAEPAPKMADGHPDLSGVWWLGYDVGGNRGGGARGGGGRGGARGPAGPSFTSLYKPEAAAKVKTLSDKDDPTLRCVPTAFGTMNASIFDVGQVGQIISTPKFVVMLTETFHGYRLVPTDGRPHRADIPPSYRGDSVGHWEGDVFVVDTRNFTDDTWMFAEGRVSPHSDELRLVERYRRVDKNTLEIEATITDPQMLTGPWTAPKQTLQLAPFDQLLPLNCSGIETQALMDAAAKQNAPK